MNNAEKVGKRFSNEAETDYYQVIYLDADGQMVGSHLNVTDESISFQSRTIIPADTEMSECHEIEFDIAVSSCMVLMSHSRTREVLSGDLGINQDNRGE